MSDAVRDYWAECVAIAASDCALTLTEEQLQCLAGAMQSGHENYGLAFYSPPSSDRYDAMQRDFDQKLAEQRREAERRESEQRRIDEDRLWTIRRQDRRIAELKEQLNGN